MLLSIGLADMCCGQAVEREKKIKDKKNSQYLSDVKEHFAIFKRYHNDCHRYRKRLANQVGYLHNLHDCAAESSELDSDHAPAV